MNLFSSIEDIIAEFELHSPLENLDELKEELKQLRTNNQPHNISRETTPEEIKSKFVRIGHAMDFIDKRQNDSKALVRVSNLPAIFEAVSKSIQPFQDKAIRESFIKQSEASFKNNLSLHVQSGFRIPRRVL